MTHIIKNVCRVVFSAAFFSIALIFGFGLLCATPFSKCYSSDEFTFNEALKLLLVVVSISMAIGVLVASTLILVKSIFLHKMWFQKISFNIFMGVFCGILPPLLFSIILGGNFDYYPAIWYVPFIFAGAVIGFVVWQRGKPDEKHRGQV